MKILLSIVAALACVAASAAEKIEGAVGVKLGETFPTHIVSSKAPAEDKVVFAPTNAVPPFRNYVAALHPVTAQVVSISAEVLLPTYSDAVAEWEKIRLLLVQKYGEPILADEKLKFANWAQDGRIVVLNGPGVATRPELSLSYVDGDLSKSARLEETKRRAKGVDSSGL